MIFTKISATTSQIPAQLRNPHHPEDTLVYYEL